MARRGSLFVDLYELTMAQVYVTREVDDRASQFEYSFRSPPDYGAHRAGFCVTAGLEPFVDWLRRLTFGTDEVAALRSITTASGSAVFGEPFLDWLVRPGRFDGIELSAVAEGRVVHPHEPIVTVTGPLAACQLLETSLLNHLNYATLVATKAARIVQSARGGRVLEFGMRRGPGAGVDEGVRAALIGGCASTSHVEAALALGVQPAGTLAHSLVQASIALGHGELAAFRSMAASAPDGCVLLVDTIDTLRSGVPNAITVFEELRRGGHEPIGIRLDSGDLADLAVRSAALLDEAGFDEVAIVLSSDLDELAIDQILAEIPPSIHNRLVYGVGTRLITSHGASALNGVYKLVGLEADDGSWAPAMKVSEEPGKITLPGRKMVWRLYDRRDVAVVDLIGLADEEPLADDENLIHDPTREGVHRVLRRDEIGRIEPLLHTVASRSASGVAELAERCRSDLEHLDVGVRRLVDPQRYHVSITDRLHRLRRELLADVSV